jgi:hypothetical protein
MDIKQFWSEVTDEQKKLTDAEGKPLPFVYMISITRRKPRTVGGKVFVCQPKLAARLIVEDTHRPANREEIEAYLEQQAEESKRLKQVALQEKAGHLTVLSPELAAHLSAAAPAEPVPMVGGPGKRK